MNIQIFNDFKHVEYKGVILHYDECRIYDNFYLELYSQGKFMMDVECNKIEVQQWLDEHYYIKLINDSPMGYDCLYLKLKENKDTNENLIICNVGDIVYRNNYNTEENVKVNYEMTRKDKNLHTDTTLLIFGSKNDKHILDIFSIDKINELVGWNVTNVINNRIVEIERNGVICIELIKNISNMDNIRKSIKMFDDMKNSKEEK